jgi:hypothetical protein
VSEKLTQEEREALDDIIEVAEEVAEEWSEEILGMISEDLEPDARQSMKDDNVDDEETQDAILGITGMASLYRAYRTALANIEGNEARAYVQQKIEKELRSEARDGNVVPISTPVPAKPPTLGIRPGPEPATTVFTPPKIKS